MVIEAEKGERRDEFSTLVRRFAKRRIECRKRRKTFNTLASTLNNCHCAIQPLILLGFMAGTTGLEPATSAVTGQRSDQLSYVPSIVSWNHDRES